MKIKAKMHYSRQREAIMAYLQSTREHPTAEMVYAHIRKEHPHISLATVYRNLNLLAERKEIIKLTCGGGSDRFDANTCPHHHFLCQTCSRVIDLPVVASLDHINILAAAGFEGEISGHSIYFYGICPSCKKKQKNS